MKAKIMSLLLAGVVLLVSWRTHVSEATGVTSVSLLLVSLAPIFVFFGLLSVWLSDYRGSFAGPMFRGGYVDSPTPVIAFVAFGYLLLVLPLLAFLFHAGRHGTQAI